MKKSDIKMEIIKISKKLYDRQMVNSNEGNVSIRSGDKVFITPSQVCKDELTEDMICVTDLEGNQLEGSMKPSSEIGLHLHIYKLRSDIKGIVHCHAPYSTAFAIARKPIVSKGYTEMIVLYDKIPVAAYGAPSTPEIYKDVKTYIHQTDAFLLANHGLVTVGKTLKDAYLLSESVESIARTLLYAHLLGGEYPLTQPELNQLYEMRKKNLGKDPVTP
ncbi:MAG: class II aldolase/adducin family protein [Clostridiales bacterium]|jgi:L-fuculose-phosphate aldolase|nr:class II aldolase/adducin family protein [Clostridiales bacterium]